MRTYVYTLHYLSLYTFIQVLHISATHSFLNRSLIVLGRIVLSDDNCIILSAKMRKFTTITQISRTFSFPCVYIRSSLTLPRCKIHVRDTSFRARTLRRVRALTWLSLAPGRGEET